MTAALGKSIIASLAFELVAAEARVITLKPVSRRSRRSIVVRRGRYASRRAGGKHTASFSAIQGRALWSFSDRGATVERLTIDGNRAKLAQADADRALRSRVRRLLSEQRNPEHRYARHQRFAMSR